MARLFFALDIKPSDKAVIQAFSAEQLPALKQPTATSNLHITLAFLGQVSPEQQRCLLEHAHRLSSTSASTSQQEKTLTLNHLGVFSKAKVLYLGLAKTPEWLSFLAQKLSHEAKGVGLFQEQRPYRPHVTIARKTSDIPEVITSPNLTIKVNSFSLYQSQSTDNGVVYYPLKTFWL